jgi:hypothetical protein
MQYTFHLKPHYFANMKEGSKRLELRLNDEKRRLLKIGDTILNSRLKAGKSWSPELSIYCPTQISHRWLGSLIWKF